MCLFIFQLQATSKKVFIISDYTESCDKMVEEISEVNTETMKKFFEGKVKIKPPELDSFEKQYIGKIITEYPFLVEDFDSRYNIYLAEKNGRYSIILRWTDVNPKGESEPRYERFNMENVQKLRDFFDDAIKTADANPLKKNIE
jgi:hypothetical protein